MTMLFVNYGLQILEQPIVLSYHKKNDLPIKYTKNPKIYEETFAS